MAAGDDSSVPLGTPTGNVDTRLAANGDHRQVVAIGNAGDVVANVTPWGAQDTFVGVSTLFYDTFVGPLDTTDKWTVTGTAPTFSNGVLTMSATASTYSAIRSKDNIRANAGRTYVANGITVEATAAAGSGRFWGLGTPATTPSATSLAQDGIGFEIDQATGNLLAVTYAAGVRTTVATLTRPADGLVHRYAMYFRVTDAQWYIDGLSVPVATASFPGIVVPEVPALIARNNAASTTGVVFTNTAHLTGDTSPSTVLRDPVVGTRQARVDANGNQLVQLAAGTNSIGTVIPHTDTARVAVSLSVSGLASVTTEGLITLTQWRLGATTTGTTYTVPVGKVFRIQTVQFGARFSAPSTTVTFASTTFRVRAVATGTATATSAILHQDSKLAASNVATPNSDLTIADGLDLPAGYNFGVTHVASATTLAEDVLILGYEYTP